ncbi:hypothetical protein ZIOFF_019157 [Zingiber officinale]|uniref:Uncharacterized protein n=1 Tax=Zingiber officinale TaxID=94328 RepID=A0A8J5HHF4_ZINOF|nr:hypothetical protein ZIOFF_019157 [Zingiber officinale]
MLECCCYLHWYSRVDYSCWCSSSPAGLILYWTYKEPEWICSIHKGIDRYKMSWIA